MCCVVVAVAVAVVSNGTRFFRRRMLLGLKIAGLGLVNEVSGSVSVDLRAPR